MSRAFGFAPLASSTFTSAAASSVSTSLGSGLINMEPNVCMSTAAYKAAIPLASARFGSAPLSSSTLARSKCALMMATTSAVAPSGSCTFRLAPVSASATTASVAFCLAAYINGVQPPRGSAVETIPWNPTHFHSGGVSTFERALGSAPC